MAKARHYYAFGYKDTRTTTTGGDNGQALYIAGRLLRFNSRAERDVWVRQGFSFPVPPDKGEFRRAVITQGLPLGWYAHHAEDYGDADGVIGNYWYYNPNQSGILHYTKNGLQSVCDRRVHLGHQRTNLVIGRCSQCNQLLTPS